MSDIRRGKKTASDIQRVSEEKTFVECLVCKVSKIQVCCYGDVLASRTGRSHRDEGQISDCIATAGLKMVQDHKCCGLHGSDYELALRTAMDGAPGIGLVRAPLTRHCNPGSDQERFLASLRTHAGY